MNPKDYPFSNIGSEASTADCKALLERIPASEHPGGKAGDWKRKSKTGSGARVEREFLNASGLAALVVQSPGRLTVEAVANSFIELQMRPKADPVQKTKADRPADQEARAGAAQLRKVERAMEMAGEEEDEDDEPWIALVREAAGTPSGSPLRVAIGNQFQFQIPGPDSYDEDVFEIVSLGGYPEPDQPHWLEILNDALESPNESCTHWLHMEPAAGIRWLLDNGFAHDATQDLSLADPTWAAPLLALREADAIEKASGPAQSSRGRFDSL